MPIDEKIIKHESFGYIRASRVSGQTTLFDSGLQHQHYVIITIGEAVQSRSYNNTSIYTRGDLVQVAMSEGQFAQFITSMNVGSGAPCTLQRVQGKAVPPPPLDINTKETYEEEVKERCDKIGESLSDALQRAEDLVAKGKAGKAELQQMMDALRATQREITQNFPFMQRMMAENMEKLVQQAKADINAHAVMMAQRLSVESGADSSESISLVGFEEK